MRSVMRFITRMQSSPRSIATMQVVLQVVFAVSLSAICVAVAYLAATVGE